LGIVVDIKNYARVFSVTIRSGIKKHVSNQNI